MLAASPEHSTHKVPQPMTSCRSLTRVAIAASLVLASFTSGFAQDGKPADAPLTALPYSPSFDQSSMDPSANACVDFYQYACGGWQKKNPIPADQSSWSVYGKLHDENLHYLWGLLNEVSAPRADRTPSEQKTGDYFAACMDEAAIDAAGAKPIDAALQRVAQLKSTKDAAALIGWLHLTGTDNAMFRFGSDQDYADSTQVIPIADAGGLGLPDRDQYLKMDAKSKDIRKAYQAHVARMFELLGDSKETAAGNAIVVVAMETDLAKSSLTREEQRDPHKIYHRMNFAQLKKTAPHFDWATYFKALDVPTSQSVNVTQPAFYKKLDRLLAKRSLADWKTYLRWKVVDAQAANLAKPFEQANFDFFSTKLRGVEKMPPRWKTCVRAVDRDLGEALGQVFAKRTFAPETKQRAADMTRAIEVAMEGRINNLDWMSATTKKAALEKLHSLVNKIGYPEKWRDYSALDVKPGDFFGNVQRAQTFEAKRQLGKIGKPVDRTEWGMTPPTVNAYYNAQMNDINFPAGILQPPLFDPKMDDAPNFGNTGATIGHELTHGFDDEGRQFDAKGNLRDWWTKKDADEFLKRTSCIVEQYSGYTVVDDIKINGKLTLGEDVADLGGTILAYVAWKATTAGQKLADIDGFTPDQRFFIGMAQWACSNIRPETLRLQALTDPHSPSKYRVNGVVANMPEFARAFSCKPGQPMVRDKVCKVW
jgi:putative endopeptidase